MLDSQIKDNLEVVIPLDIQKNNQEVILPAPRTFVAGCLPNFLAQWESITEDPVTLDAVTGFTIPLTAMAPSQIG